MAQAAATATILDLPGHTQHISMQQCCCSLYYMKYYSTGACGEGGHSTSARLLQDASLEGDIAFCWSQQGRLDRPANGLAPSSSPHQGVTSIAEKA